MAPPRCGAKKLGRPSGGGIVQVRGRDPVHFDPHLTRNARTHTALSFVYSKLLRHKVGADVEPGTFIIEPDLAERWESPDDTTYVFHLRHDVKWHNKPPVKGREVSHAQDEGYAAPAARDPEAAGALAAAPLTFSASGRRRPPRGSAQS
jgi:ABC-type transport system substrate-binding protein